MPDIHSAVRKNVVVFNKVVEFFFDTFCKSQMQKNLDRQAYHSCPPPVYSEAYFSIKLERMEKYAS